MYTFKQFLLIEKNLHQLHLEQYALRGVYSLRRALEILLDLRNQFYTTDTGENTVNVKFDGAPAVICGIDPNDGQFFVGTKGVFSKTPKLAKSLQQVDELYGTGPAEKLKLAYQYLKPIIRDGIYQGDLLYDQEILAKNVIDGKEYFTFRPNTITYAVPAQSELGNKIGASKLGIVFHTHYTGDDFATMESDFHDVDLSSKSTRDALILSPKFSDKSATIAFTPEEYQQVTNFLSDIGKKSRELDHPFFDEFDNTVLDIFEIYINTQVREGSFSNVTVDHFKEWLERYYEEKVYPKFKRLEPKKQELQTKLDWIDRNANDISLLIEVYFDIMKAKQLFVNKFNNIESDMATFIETDKGFKVTSHEGYVAVDAENNIVKLVDRLEFSKNNFNIAKNWK